MSAAAASESKNLEQLLLVIRRRWRMLLLCVVLVTAAAVGFSELQQKQYTASASLLFRDTQFDQELFGANFTPSVVDPTQEQATNIDLVSLPTVASRTAAALHLPAGLVKSEVTISAVGQSNIAQINVIDPDPSRAASIANSYAQQFVLFRQEADRSKITAAQQLVQQEISQLPASERLRSVGQTLQNRANQLGVLAALQTGNAEVAQTAGVPSSPSSPDTRRNGILGVLVGLLLGIGAMFVAERLDRRIRDESELESIYGVPLLGSVPDSAAYQAAGTEEMPVAEREAFALLRARLRYFNVDRDVQTILTSSAIPGEGKTTVALNLAIAEATAGTNVILVEADLRAPVIAQRLGLRPRPGLADILSRNASLDSVLQEARVPRHAEENGTAPRLTVLTAGPIPPNPAELIESRAMIDLLSSLSERFDRVIIDTPPTSIVSDAIPLMRLVGGVVVISRVNQTTRDAARHLREQLLKLNAPTLGVVANAMPTKARGRYGYGYGYGYQYQAQAADRSGQPQGPREAERSAPAEDRSS